MTENCIQQGIRSPSPEIYGCYLRDIFPNMLSNIFSDFISDKGVTVHRHCMIYNIENKIESLHL